MVRGSGAGITWTNIVVTLGFGVTLAVTLAGAGWTIFQNQFGYQTQRIETMTAEINKHEDQDVKRNEVLRGDMERRLRDIIEDLDKRRSEFVAHPEMNQIEKRIAIMNEQLLRLESTRPTTGELQAIGTGSSRDIVDIKERLRSLEDNLRRPQILAPVTQQPQTPAQSPVPQPPIYR